MPHFAPAQHEDHDGSTVGGVRPKNILQLDFISQLEDDHSNGLCRAWRTSLPNRKRLSDESDRAVQATAPLRSRFRRPAHSQARGGIGVHIPWLWKNPKPVRLMGPDASIPGVFQALAAVSEFGGGLFWMLGLFTPLASLGLACTMTVAVRMHAFMMHDPFVSPTGGRSYEPAVVYLCVAALLLLAGPGRLSLDRVVFSEKTRDAPVPEETENKQ